MKVNSFLVCAAAATLLSGLAMGGEAADSRHNDGDKPPELIQERDDIDKKMDSIERPGDSPEKIQDKNDTGTGSKDAGEHGSDSRRSLPAQHTDDPDTTLHPITPDVPTAPVER
ncbi:hypothetical protein [Azomonas macrocytogenes]|uniref:Secreted protein n=1 Tax=Azomonas macrocytogenes TaxID=69962 RepID=A0A839T3W4_AZOMA|nr:hypothetical protein [Azomonas macrocytogenes]MBB3104102.1 hypothetical protein [Azomonas macrocytogenes]